MEWVLKKSYRATDKSIGVKETLEGNKLIFNHFVSYSEYTPPITYANEFEKQQQKYRIKYNNKIR